jgi:putative inorganic carbon (HCO3(-)) transporter
MLRTIFIFLIIVFGGIASLTSSFNALLFYLWIAYFRPESWLWDTTILQLVPLSFVVGIWTLVATLLYGAKPRFDVRALLLMAILAISTIATFSGVYTAYALPFWQDFAKCILMTYILSILVHDERRARMTFIVIALSLGFEAGKQGLAQLVLNPGAKNENYIAMLGDENLTAVGMFMLAPIIVMLGRTSRVKWHVWGWRLLALGVIYRGISTYSRGGFLACGAVTLVAIWRSPHRVRSLAAVVLAAMLIVPVLPDAYWNRMDTIDAKQEDRDASAEGRVHFWQVAVLIANANPIVGIGHNAYNAAYDKYDFSRGKYGENRSVHSAWFGILAELGYSGLMVFVMSLILAFSACWRTRRLAATLKDGRNLLNYSLALECSLVAFMVGGSFVPFQYNEMIWHVIGMTMALDTIVRARYTQQLSAEAESASMMAVA